MAYDTTANSKIKTTTTNTISDFLIGIDDTGVRFLYAVNARFSIDMLA